MALEGWQFWIDVGGTFTDCVARTPDGRLRTHKLLSTGVYKGRVGRGSSRGCVRDPARRDDPEGFFEGFELTVDGVAARVTRFERARARLWLDPPLPGDPHPGRIYELRSGEEAPLTGIRWLSGLRLGDPIGPVAVRLGTTRGTNALLERAGARTALVTTAGLADVLRIGYQDRPRLFELHIRKPLDLFERVVEIDERLDAEGRILRPLCEAHARERLAELRDAGIVALAVCLLHAHRNPDHERRVGRIAAELGFAHVRLSSEVSPHQRIVPRGDTTVVDAYVAPVIREYVRALRARLPGGSLKLMTSSGGLTDADAFSGRDSILSGPAGGAVAIAEIARRAGCLPAIGFDMGGTSTDVCRFDGQLERRYELRLFEPQTQTAARIVAPMLAIESVAAGGGSVCDFDGVKPVVGPRSAGADPGPACYGRGGPLCLTDANVLLGRIPEAAFAFPLDVAAARARIDALIERIASATGRRYSPDELAAGFLAIANEKMAAAIRRISVARGFDVREHVLICFGGAGGQHACAVADLLGVRRILLHPLGGLLSAYGVGVADVRRIASRDVGRPLSGDALRALADDFAELESSLRDAVRAEGVAAEDVLAARRSLDLRYHGQDATIEVPEPPDADYAAAFERLHRQRFGFHLSGRPIEIRALRVEVVGRSAVPTVASGTPRGRAVGTRLRRAARDAHRAWFDGTFRDTPTLVREALAAGARVTGPAIILEAFGTIVVEPGWSAEVAHESNLLLTRGAPRPAAPRQAAPAEADGEPDPILLELFNNRFAAVAEQMGVTLRQTALSTNVKERLDFSCALFDSDAALVVNAPHIPVHIGSMSESVRRLRDAVPDMRPGDVYVTNHPLRGGTHLPDVTVITPVFAGPADREPIFYAASRAHHAEIGGVAPGSMPAFSSCLAEEGVLIDAFRLVRDGAIEEDGLRALLAAGPYPSRAVEDNVADIHAQAAANQTGAALLSRMIAELGRARVLAYMRHIQRAAERKMRLALAALPDGRYAFTDHLDDGSPLCVTIAIAGGSARVDFTGTGPVLPGNLNANRAIVSSAVLYCFRCLIPDDVPLNAGLLAPIEIVLPECFLNPPPSDDPARCAAVAGGNVETSQRIVDAVLGALGVVAASQGTMNNLVFGDATFGYYETIGGGAGAGPGFDGADAVHTHMTNTRLTDPEVLEERYPVRLRRFAIRRGSGGAGRHRGGDGIVREFEFLAPLEVSLITQRRTRAPYGLRGGEPGARGRNLLRRAGGAAHELPGIARFDVRPGDVLRIETPGGGGFDPPAGRADAV